MGPLPPRHRGGARQLLSTVAARDTVRLALTAQVARTYFDLRAYDQQLQVARDTLASRESTQELRKVRFELGLTSELDYRQAIAEAAAARSTVHSLQYNVAASEAALGVLTGRSPRDIVTGTVDRGLAVDAVPVPPPCPPGCPRPCWNAARTSCRPNSNWRRPAPTSAWPRRPTSRPSR